MILTCRQLVEKVTDAREGGLSKIDRMSYRAHLAWCRNCRRYVAQMEQTISALRRPPDDKSEAGGAPREVVAALLVQARKGRPKES